MNEQTVYGHITRTPGVCGGKPRISGHRIRVQDIVQEYQGQGRCPEEICGQHPGLTLAKVYAALAYFFDHRDEILGDMENDDQQIAEFLRQHPDGIQRGKC